jgi:hypothetical protein
MNKQFNYGQMSIAGGSMPADRFHRDNVGKVQSSSVMQGAIRYGSHVAIKTYMGEYP